MCFYACFQVWMVFFNVSLFDARSWCYCGCFPVASWSGGMLGRECRFWGVCNWKYGFPVVGGRWLFRLTKFTLKDYQRRFEILFMEIFTLFCLFEGYLHDPIIPNYSTRCFYIIHRRWPGERFLVLDSLLTWLWVEFISLIETRQLRSLLLT